MLEIQNRTVRYGAVTALDAVSVKIAAGERVAVAGPNGAGKTTLLKALAGGNTAIVPQDLPRALEMTAREFVMLGRTEHLSPWRAPGAADVRAVRDALAAVGAEALAARRIGALSGGERQRLAIALALATERPALLLDEPAAHLDFRRRGELLQLLARLDRTVVCSTHDLPFDSAFFTRVILMSGGKIVADGAPAAVLAEANIALAWGVPVRVEAARRACLAR